MKLLFRHSFCFAGKMSLLSSYDNDFQSYGDKARKPKHVTKEDIERPKFVDLKRPDEHIPMFTETQTMVDYKYDPNQFRSVWVPKKVDASSNKIIYRSLVIFFLFEGARGKKFIPLAFRSTFTSLCNLRR